MLGKRMAPFRDHWRQCFEGLRLPQGLKRLVHRFNDRRSRAAADIELLRLQNRELFADRVVELLPIGPKRAKSMLKRLKCWPLLDGYRGKPRVAIDEAIKAIELVAILASQCKWIEELDINPLLVGPRGAVALDGRVVVKSPS